MSTMLENEEGRTLSTTVVENPSQLSDYLASGCKAPEDWRIGTEHEKFGFDLKTLAPIPYDGPGSVRALFDGLSRFGWEPVIEDGLPIAMHMDGQTISLEPGGQLELSGAPLETLHQTCREVNTHLDQVKEVSQELGIGFLGLGHHPTAARADMPKMPKARYGLMTRYMPTRGNLGLDMMYRTCTIQVNLDFGSEEDMVEKFRISLALQPLATALFSCSPFRDGQPTGLQSTRAHVWTDTDPDRSGTLPFVFDDSFGFERYAEYVMDVPMYFVYRDGRYIDAMGQSFRDFMDGRLPALPGEKPTMKDWDIHLTTVFPDVRMKRFLEMRGADGGPWRSICALPAFWVGLLYDSSAQAEALELIRGWTAADIEAMRAAVPEQGLKAPAPGGRTMLQVARDVLAISDRGLAGRARLDGMGQDERHFLGMLRQIVDSGQTQSDRLLARFNGEWQGDATRVFSEYAY